MVTYHTPVISKKATYRCNRMGNCSDCVAFHRTFGGIPICLDAQNRTEEDEEQKRRAEEIKMEKERLEQEKRIAEIRKEKERIAEQRRIEEEIKREKAIIEQEKILAKIKEDTEHLDKQSIWAEEIESFTDEENLEEGEENEETSEQENYPAHIEVYFRCCCVYGKLYLSINKSHYIGKCPKCRAKLTAPASSKAPRFGLRQ